MVYKYITTPQLLSEVIQMTNIAITTDMCQTHKVHRLLQIQAFE